MKRKIRTLFCWSLVGFGVSMPTAWGGEPADPCRVHFSSLYLERSEILEEDLSSITIASSSPDGAKMMFKPLVTEAVLREKDWNSTFSGAPRLAFKRYGEWIDDARFLVRDDGRYEFFARRTKADPAKLIATFNDSVSATLFACGFEKLEPRARAVCVGAHTLLSLEADGRVFQATEGQWRDLGIRLENPRANTSGQLSQHSLWLSEADAKKHASSFAKLGVPVVVAPVGNFGLIKCGVTRCWALDYDGRLVVREGQHESIVAEFGDRRPVIGGGDRIVAVLPECRRAYYLSPKRAAPSDAGTGR